MCIILHLYIRSIVYPFIFKELFVCVYKAVHAVDLFRDGTCNCGTCMYIVYIYIRTKININIQVPMKFTLLAEAVLIVLTALGSKYMQYIHLPNIYKYTNSP